jgi:hypothetical protein
VVSPLWLAIAVAGVWALIAAIILGRRWRARPIPARPRGEAARAAAPEQPVGCYVAVDFRRKWAYRPLLVIVPCVAFGVFIVPFVAIHPEVDATTKVPVVAVFGFLTLFLAWWGWVFLRRLVSDRPALYIDDEGIVDKSDGAFYRRIHWREIRRLRWVPISPLYLAADLSRPDEYLARQAGWRRLVELWNWKTRHNPVRINVTALDISPDELGKLLEGRVPIVDYHGAPWSPQD